MKKLLKVALPLVLLLTGCQKSSDIADKDTQAIVEKDKALAILLTTETEGMKYSYREKENSMSQKMMAEKAEDEVANKISLEAIDAIKNGFKTLKLVEDKEENFQESNLLYIVFPTNETTVYLYQDGMIKTISNYTDRHFYQLQGSDEIISQIQTNLEEFQKMAEQ